LDPKALFPDPVTEVWLEVGFGGGEHLAAQARRHPQVGLIGCEPYVNGVARLLSLVEGDRLTNLRVFDNDARLLLDRLADASIDRVFVLFSDPWPKKRHQKRRFIGEETLRGLARVMRDGGLLRFASDEMGYVRWTLEHLHRNPDFLWAANRPEDWRRPPADGAETRYETKARAAGRTCVYLDFRRRFRGAPSPT
jgi:tRNA (guanine-N7-)-methyltransferase